jgi:hypothetical protein
MPNDPNIHKMAHGCYGYGRWGARYWFIGPEQGMKKSEDLQRRVDVWHQLGGQELNDCREFHELLPELRWHGENPKLQKTWKQLILLLLAVRDEPITNDCRRDYQRTRWGMQNGETCVIELSGLPSHCYDASTKQKKKLFEPGEFERIRDKRIGFICDKILQHSPRLVVMYGISEKKHWDKIAEVKRRFTHDTEVPILVQATHPVSFEGVEDEYWRRLAIKIRTYTAD